MDYLKSELDKIKGHLVEFPLDFLSEVDLIAFDGAVNPLTMEVYI